MEIVKTILINCFGGPGTGKSTTACGLFYALKSAGINCEYVPEYAKEVTWGKLFPKFDDQLYIFAKQHHKLFVLQGQVKYIITDSPLLLSLIYYQRSHKELDTFGKLVIEKHFEFNNVNIMLNRHKKYEPAGRNQTYEEAVALDLEIRDMLGLHNIKNHVVNADVSAVDSIIKILGLVG